MVDYSNVINVGIGMIIIISIGYILCKKGIFVQKDTASVNSFVFKVCFLPLLAKGFATKKMNELDFRPFFVSTCMVLSLFIILSILFLFPLKDKFGYYLSTILPITYINYIISGLPIFNALWSSNENVVISLMTLSNDLIAGPIYLTLVGFYNVSLHNKKRKEEGLEDEEYSFAVCGRVMFNVFKSPILLGNIIGIIYSLTGLPFPIYLLKLTQYMGDKALPLALFGVGVFLAQHSLMSCEWSQFFICLFSRFFLSALVSIGFCLLFGLPSRLSRQCIIIGAQPTAVASYILSSNAGIGQNVASTMILWSTVITVPVIVILFSLLDYFNLFIE